jgi:hypothetical protein
MQAFYGVVSTLITRRQLYSALGSWSTAAEPQLSAAERRAENIKWRRRGANQKLLKTCLALAIMADTWTWSADHQDYYRYTNENGNKTGLIIKITAEVLTRSRTLGDSLGKTGTAARRSAEVCLSDQILALIHLTCFQ